MRVLLLIFCGLIIGCTSQPAARYIDRPVRVEVPVLLPCPVTEPPRRGYATAGLVRDSTPFEKIRALLVERKERAATESELRELLGACTSN